MVEAETVAPEVRGSTSRERENNIVEKYGLGRSYRMEGEDVINGTTLRKGVVE